MSQWTHVNASIRFDSIFGEGLPDKEILGKICRWGDEDTSHLENNPIPCGSEGSIEYNIHINPNTSAIATMVIVFYGDLRDYEDVEEILNYFTKLTSEGMIRSGVLEIDVEFQATYVYRFDSDVKKWVLANKYEPEVI